MLTHLILITVISWCHCNYRITSELKTEVKRLGKGHTASDDKDPVWNQVSGSRAHPLSTALSCLSLVIVGMSDCEGRSKANKQKAHRQKWDE